MLRGNFQNKLQVACQLLGAAIASGAKQQQQQ